jgi:hypothetical protein
MWLPEKSEFVGGGDNGGEEGETDRLYNKSSTTVSTSM